MQNWHNRSFLLRIFTVFLIPAVLNAPRNVSAETPTSGGPVVGDITASEVSDPNVSNVGSSGPYYIDLNGAWFEREKTLAPEPAPGALFGDSVDVRGDLMVVGASGDSTEAYKAGAAHIYVRTNGVWRLDQTVRPRRPEEGAMFGATVAIGAECVAVGAPYAGRTGMVYTYVPHRRGGWRRRQRIRPRRTREMVRFGRSIDIDGEVMVVGGDWASDAGAYSGAAYVFTGGSRWRQRAQIIGHDTDPNDLFGSSVAVEGEVVAVGAVGKAADAGAVYVFEKTGRREWTQQAMIRPDQKWAGNRFAASLAMSEGRLIAGATGAITGEGRSGIVYIFEYDGSNWIQAVNLTPSNALEDNMFGSAVAADANNIIVGAPLAIGPLDDPNDTDGEAYLFTRQGDTWLQQARLGPSDPTDGSIFGSTVALDGDTAVISSPYKAVVASSGNTTGPSARAGAVYSFDLIPPADLNGDSLVDFYDFAILADQYSGASDLNVADISPFTEPGAIDLYDLLSLTDQWLNAGP